METSFNALGREAGTVMRTVHIRPLAVLALGALALAANAAAQNTSTAILNTVELRQLITRMEPGDHLRLTAHFTALADQYAAEARRHSSMARGFGGNPTRDLGTGMSIHCKRLSDLNSQSAATTRTLAAYHEKLAGGAPATAPAHGATFEEGAGAKAPTAQELEVLAAKASTSVEHRVLEEYFQSLATRYAAEAGEHTAVAQFYRSSRSSYAAVYHDQLARLASESAKEAREAAAMHTTDARGAR